MIHLTRLNRVPLVLNSDLIEHIETTPDTVVSLTTGQKFLVLESADEIIERVIGFRRAVVGKSSRPENLARMELASRQSYPSSVFAKPAAVPVESREDQG